MGHRLRQLAEMPWHERWLLLESAVALVIIDAALRLLPFRRVMIWTARHPRVKSAKRPEESRPTVDCVQRLASMAAYSLPYAMPCLRRALATQWLLRRRGIDAELHFGVRREFGVLSAHAWLEFAGQPIGERQPVEAGFVPLVVQAQSQPPAEP